ncbi:MAG: lipopolysaccharide kinase InaA family protein [Planctomycetota bacterium]|nr:lipopolysaccharide kinase InaA family protein [Planctomycetota bacterium]MDP6942092.1 lipopolysaccharide kinase InaA family protein [Planctomycetota bacterium]
MKNFGSGNKARKGALLEFQNSGLLQEEGVPCVQAWAVVQNADDYLLFLTDYGESSSLDREKLIQNPRLLKKLGALVSKLHSSNLVHGDLHIWNLLHDNEDIFLTDLKTLRSSSSSTARLLDFGHLLSRLNPLPTELLLTLSNAYSGNIAPPEMEKAGWVRFREHQCNLDRRAKREAHGTHPAIWRIDSFDTQTIQTRTLLKDKAESPSSVHLAVLPDSSSAVYKHYRPTKRLDLRNAFGFSKALKSLFAAESLQRRNIQAAKPLACWSDSSVGSFLLLEDLSHLPRLQDSLAELSQKERRKLLQELGAFTLRLHQSGVYYRDLKPSNILVNQDASTENRFVLIDHDRNRFLRRQLRPTEAAKDLAALHVGLYKTVPARDLLFGLKQYGISILPHLEFATAARLQKRGQAMIPFLTK